MIRFRTKTILQVIENFDEKTDAITEECEETFNQGEKVDADIFSQEEDYADLQFADGSVSFHVPKDSFEEI